MRSIFCISKIYLSGFLVFYCSLIFASDCDEDDLRITINNSIKFSYLQSLKKYHSLADCFLENDDKVGWMKAQMEIQDIIRIKFSYDSAIQYVDNVISIFGEPLSFEERRVLIWAHLQNGYNNANEDKIIRYNYGNIKEINNCYEALYHYQRAIELINKDCTGPNYWDCYHKISIGNYIMHNLANIYRDHDSILKLLNG